MSTTTDFDAAQVARMRRAIQNGNEPAPDDLSDSHLDRMLRDMEDGAAMDLQRADRFEPL